VQGVEATRRQPLGDADEHVLARPPRRHRIGFVEAAHVQHLLPQPFQRVRLRQVGIDERRPRRRRARHGRPVRRARVDDLAGLAQERQLVAAGARRVEVAQQPGRDRAGQPDARGAVLAEGEQPLAQPRRHVVERALVGVEDPRALDVQVEQRHVDVLRPRAVGRRGDSARDLELAGLGADRDDLAALHVGGEVHDQLGEASQRRAVDRRDPGDAGLGRGRRRVGGGLGRH